MARWVLISATQPGVLIFFFIYSWIFLKLSRICFGTQAVASTNCAVLSSAVVCVANATITSANISDTNTGCPHRELQWPAPTARHIARR